MSKTHCKHGHERTPENIDKYGGCKSCDREAHRARLADPDRNARINARRRERYAQSEELRTANRQRFRRRYYGDPEFRAHTIATATKRSYRLRHDPNTVDAVREFYRLAAEAQRRANGVAPIDFQRSHQPRQSPASERMPAAPLLTWLAAWIASHPLSSEAQLCDWAHVAHRTVLRALEGEQDFLSLDTIDRLLIAGGEPPETLHALYPIEVLRDDGTGNFAGGFDGKPGAAFPVVLPEPHPTPLHIKTKSVDDWEPRWESWPPEHRAVLQRLRAELNGAKWRRHSIAWLNQQKVAA